MTVDYKQMYREELSIFNSVHWPTDEQAIECFGTYWDKAAEENYHRLLEVRIARRIWAGIGLFVFGKVEYREKTLQLIREHPKAIHYPLGKTCYYYLPAILSLEEIPSLSS